jgi:hypothetical protein
MGLFIKPTEGLQLYGVDISRKFIDDLLVAPAAIGCLLPGVIYSPLVGGGLNIDGSQ